MNAPACGHQVFHHLRVHGGLAQRGAIGLAGEAEAFGSTVVRGAQDHDGPLRRVRGQGPVG